VIERTATRPVAPCGSLAVPDHGLTQANRAVPR